MDPGWLRDALTLVAGVGTGILSAAFGVGGAIVSTPALRALGLPALLAVGTTLPSIIPSAISGTLRYLGEHLVDWRTVAWTTPPGIVASVGGAVTAPRVPGEGHLLMIATAVLLAFSAYRMAQRGPTSEAEVAPEAVVSAAGPCTPANQPAPPMLVAIGVVAGGLSGLLGIGGGIVMVPAFNQLARIPLKATIATSLACVALFAVPGTITHALQDGIDWRSALLLAVGVVPGARMGAALTLRVSAARLRSAVAGFLGLVSAFYLGGELIAL